MKLCAVHNSAGYRLMVRMRFFLSFFLWIVAFNFLLIGDIRVESECATKSGFGIEEIYWVWANIVAYA